MGLVTDVTPGLPPNANSAPSLASAHGRIVPGLMVANQSAPALTVFAEMQRMAFTTAGKWFQPSRTRPPARLPPPALPRTITMSVNAEPEGRTWPRYAHPICSRMKLAVSGMQPIGETPSGNRRIGLVAGGTFEGPKLRGTVLPGGADWIIGRPDGVTTLDVRIVLQTDDGAAIGLTYRGLRHGPADGHGEGQQRPVRRSVAILLPHRR